MVLTKTIKIHDETLRLLTILKGELKEQYPTEDITFDGAVYQLLTEYEENNDPEEQEKKKEKILEDYVTRSSYRSLEEKSVQWMTKYNTLCDEHQRKIREFDERIQEADAKEKRLNEELIEIGNTVKKLQDDIVHQVAVLNNRKNELIQKLNDIKADLQSGSQSYPTSLAGIYGILLDKYFKTP